MNASVSLSCLVLPPKPVVIRHGVAADSSVQSTFQEPPSAVQPPRAENGTHSYDPFVPYLGTNSGNLLPVGSHQARVQVIAVEAGVKTEEGIGLKREFEHHCAARLLASRHVVLVAGRGAIVVHAHLKEESLTK